MRESVTQKDFSGCGAACVAFVAGISYQEAVFRLGKNKAKKKGFFCPEIQNVLRRLGYEYSLSYLKARLLDKIYKNETIIFIGRSKRYPDGHFLVRFGGVWMDSWINWANNGNINEARSGFRKRLPGRPVYGLFPKKPHVQNYLSG